MKNGRRRGADLDSSRAVGGNGHKLFADSPQLRGVVRVNRKCNCGSPVGASTAQRSGGYVLALKGNQGTAFAEVKSFLDDAVDRSDKTLAFLETVDKGHGRLEVRRYRQSQHLEWFADRQDWEGLRTVGMVESAREINGQRTVERRYYISRLPVEINRFAKAVRGHWSIENQLHWVLDVVFGEDQAQARTEQSAENLAAMRRLAVKSPAARQKM